MYCPPRLPNSLLIQAPPTISPKSTKPPSSTSNVHNQASRFSVPMAAPSHPRIRANSTFHPFHLPPVAHMCFHTSRLALSCLLENYVTLVVQLFSPAPPSPSGTTTKLYFKEIVLSTLGSGNWIHAHLLSQRFLTTILLRLFQNPSAAHPLHSPNQVVQQQSTIPLFHVSPNLHHLTPPNLPMPSSELLPAPSKIESISSMQLVSPPRQAPG